MNTETTYQLFLLPTLSLLLKESWNSVQNLPWKHQNIENGFKKLSLDQGQDIRNLNTKYPSVDLQELKEDLFLTL